MKRSYIILMLIAVLTLTVFCPAVALAATGDATVYELYPPLDSDAALAENVYAVSFDSDIVITFRDMPFMYGKLSLGELAYGEEDEKVIRYKWKEHEWELGDGYKVPDGKDDNSCFECVAPDAGKRTVTYCIKQDALSNFNDYKIDYFCLELSVGDEPDDLKPIWTGRIYNGDSENVDYLGTPVKTQNITLSLMQFSCDNGVKWLDDVHVEGDDVPDSIRVRVAQGYSIADGEVDAQQDVVERRIDAWTDEDEAPYVVRLIRDENATGQEVTIPNPMKNERGLVGAVEEEINGTAATGDVDATGDADATDNADTTGDADAPDNADATGDAAAPDNADATGDADAPDNTDTTGDADAPDNADATGDADATDNNEETDNPDEGKAIPTLELVLVRCDENSEPISDDEGIPLVRLSADGNGNYLPVSEAPAQLDPGAPAQLDPGAPAQLDPGAPAQLDPEAPAQLDPEAPAQLDSGASAQLDPEASVQLDPGEYMLVLRNAGEDADEDAEIKITLSEDDSQLPMNLSVAANGEGQKVQVKAGKRTTITIGEMPTDETSTDETPTDETSTDGTTADGTPTDGTPIDGTPADGTPEGQEQQAVQDEQLTRPTIVLLGKVTAPITLDKVTLGDQTLFSGEEPAPAETETGSESAPAETETGSESAPAETETGSESASTPTVIVVNPTPTAAVATGATTSDNTEYVVGSDPTMATDDAKNPSNDSNGVINVGNLASGDRLFFGGTAEPGVAPRCELRYGEDLIPWDTIPAYTFGHDESGAWSVEIGLTEDVFANLEGELRFSICYGVKKDFLSVQEGEESAEYSLKIDTKPPEGYIEFVYDGKRVIGDAIFEEREDASLEVNVGEIIGEEYVARVNDGESESDATGLSCDELESGEKEYTYTLRDDAGNESTVQATVRLVQPIGIGESSIADGEWINLACKGGTIELSGSCEIGEAIEYAFTVSNQEPVWQTTESDSNGSWTVSYALPKDMPKEGKLRFSVRYKDETLQNALGESELRSWKIDLEAPAAPELRINDGNVDSLQFVTGEELQIHAIVPEGAELASFTVVHNDADPVDVRMDDVLTAESGKYVFEAEAQDAAGNRSEAGTLEIEVADPVKLQGFENAEGNILNLSALQEGNLTLLVTADAGRSDLIVKCSAGEQEIKGVKITSDEDGARKIVIPVSKLPKPEGNQERSIALELSVQYKDLNPDLFGATWKGRVDLWPPTVQIAEIATCGNKDNYEYFRGERVMVKLLFSDGMPQLTVLSGDEEIEVKEIKEEEYNKFLKVKNIGVTQIVKDSDGKTAVYYEFIAKDSDKDQKLSLTAWVDDDAGNASEVSKVLTRYTSTKEIGYSGGPSDVLTQQKDVVVTVKGKTGIARYYLVIVGDESGKQIPIEKIPIENNGTWTLELTYDDLPKNFEGDEWEIVLRYPADCYNTNSDGKDMTCTVRILVDVVCELEWASEPKLNDKSISVKTEPGATVMLWLNGEDKGAAQADDDGIAKFDPGNSLGMDTKIQVTATDKYGNTSTIEHEITNQNAVVKPLELNTIEQVENRIVVTGTGTANMTLVLTLKNQEGEEISTEGKVDKDGIFEIEGNVNGTPESVEVQVRYEGMENAEPATADKEMDWISPKLELDGGEPTISDIGGEVTVRTEKGATITVEFRDADRKSVPTENVENDDNVMDDGNAVIRIPRLDDSVKYVVIVATDASGNVSKLELEVKATDGVRAGFDVPAENGVVDSRGELPVSGWIATRDDGEPEGLALVITQGEMSWKHESVTLQADDGRLGDEAFKSALDKTMKANHCWSFAYTLPMENWDKGEIVLSLTQDGAEIGRCSFTSGVDAKRKYGYIVICCLSLAGLAACALVLVSLNRRIRRISDGRINPDSGMSKLTERDRQQPGQ